MYYVLIFLSELFVAPKILNYGKSPSLGVSVCQLISLSRSYIVIKTRNVSEFNVTVFQKTI